jgi:hypothetical protein
MTPVGRPKGKSKSTKETVIFSIQTSKSDYTALIEAADNEQRSVSKMAAILLHKGLFPAE